MKWILISDRMLFDSKPQNLVSLHGISLRSSYIIWQIARSVMKVHMIASLIFHTRRLIQDCGRKKPPILFIQGGPIKGYHFLITHKVFKMRTTDFNSKYTSAIFILYSTVCCFRSIWVRIHCFVVDIAENELTIFNRI